MMHNPQAGIDASSAIRRFVVLRHTRHDGVHYDLMIEQGDALVTWQCPAVPESIGRGGMACLRLADHRRIYLDYEGPISGDRGEVARHDSGHCRVLSAGEATCEVEFDGARLRGPHRFTREGPADQSWRFEALAK